MKHYSIEDWADFERGHAADKKAAAMEQHLADGCRECAKARTMWQAVIQLAQNEGKYAPPNDAVRSVKSAFALARPEKSAHWVTAVAEAVFDSFRAPVLEGVRSTRTGARQMLYQHGNKSVHIRVQHEAGEQKYSLVGQILDVKNPERPVKNVPVRIRTTAEHSSDMRTNNFGEFHFEVDASDQVGIEIGRQFRFFVPLAESKGLGKAKPNPQHEN